MYINSFKSGGGVKLLIDGVECKEKEVNFAHEVKNVLHSILPTSGTFVQNPVVFNDELYSYGGNSNRSYGVKFDGQFSWTEQISAPYNSGVRAVEYKNELYMIGSAYAVKTGSVYDSSVVPYGKYFYKYDGTSWTRLTDLPYILYNGWAVIYNDEIHLIGFALEDSATNTNKQHYKWIGSGWIVASTLPFPFANAKVVVYNNEIHLLGFYNGSSSEFNTAHYKWNGTSWSSVSTLPYAFSNRTIAAVHDSEIHLMGGIDTATSKNHFVWNGTEWTEVGTLPFELNNSGSAIKFNEDLLLFGQHISSLSSIYPVFTISQDRYQKL